MTDYTELKRLAEAAKDDPSSPYIPCQVGFQNAATPEVVLSLIAENERLHKLISWQGDANIEVTISAGQLMKHMDERDQLKAENAGLRTGYQAYERGNAELKAEVEGLRKAIADIDGALEREYWGEYAGLEETRAILDAAMGQGEQS